MRYCSTGLRGFCVENKADTCSGPECMQRGNLQASQTDRLLYDNVLLQMLSSVFDNTAMNALVV